MVDRDAFAEFQSCMEAVIGRATDQRIRIILEFVAASIDPARFAELEADLDKLPDDSPGKDAVNFTRTAEQLASVAPQIAALDLDRTTPLRLLGIGRIAVPVLAAAKCFGHSVTVVARLNFVSAPMFKLFGVPYFRPKATGELPEGPFDFVIAYGGPHLSSRQAWAAWVSPFADKLGDSGRVFVALAREPNPKRNYYPDMVLSKLAQLGARVSSRHGFAMLDRAVLKKLDRNAAQSTETADSAAAAAAPATGIVPPETGRSAGSNWKIGTALVGSFTVLLGLWSRLGRPFG